MLKLIVAFPDLRVQHWTFKVRSSPKLLPSEEGTENIRRTLGRKTWPESELDCLNFAIFSADSRVVKRRFGAGAADAGDVRLHLSSTVHVK